MHLRALRGAGTHVIRPMGIVELCVTHGNYSFLDYFLVVDDDVPILLGNRATRALGLSVQGFPQPSNVAPKLEDNSRSADTAQLFDIDAPQL